MERELLRAGHTLVAGMDEVGRGALAGPVSVGVVVVRLDTPTAPAGLKDSKLLPPATREALAPRVRRWAHTFAVGHAGPEEIDEFGILPALRLAGLRALAECGVVPDVVLLDGNHDWLTPPVSSAQLTLDLDVAARPQPRWPEVSIPPVRTRIKADMTCSSVAGASVLAKVERDARMVALADEVPEYGWAINKGYAAPEHRAALLRHGPCGHHRRSWRLLGEDPAQVTVATERRPGMGHDGSVKVRLT